MAEVTFTETLDWLDEHKGQRVVVEVGCKDPRTDNADFAVTGVTRIPFEDVDASEMGGIELDTACFHAAKIHLGLLKVWQHDVYVILRPIGF
jgi:hypothetical protein